MSFREPMFLITDRAGSPVGAVAVENGRWIGRDTAGRGAPERQPTHRGRTPQPRPRRARDTHRTPQPRVRQAT